LNGWVAKTFHPLELVRNIDRYKRLILAVLMSAVLVISIIFVGSFLLPGQSVSSDVYNYVEIFIERAWQWNYTMHGQMWYNITTDEGLVTLQVINITIEKAVYANQLLVSCLDGKNLTMKMPGNSTATKIIAYATYLAADSPRIPGWNGTTPDICTPSPGWLNRWGQPKAEEMIVSKLRMKLVYMHAESFLAPQGLNLTFT